VALPTFVCSFARSACDLFDPSAFVETCPVVSWGHSPQPTLHGG
jgi:hypothetical protein